MVDSKENETFDLGVKGLRDNKLIKYQILKTNLMRSQEWKGWENGHRIKTGTGMEPGNGCCTEFIEGISIIAQFLSAIKSKLSK